ncbi:MAG TPA: hypothetical protein VK492_12270 [Chitinophagaceae bacterium]|nr:hypothetical protein [Chitinophagaceae bacterium]
MKKLENLGKMLSEEEKKKIKGGVDDPGGDCEDRCSTNADCNGSFICAKDLIPGCGWNYKRCTIG